MEGLTPDQVEQILIEEEANIARSRARQMAALRAADAMQLPTADGCKSMREWVAGRLDVSPETAYLLTSTANRLIDAPQLSRELITGEITFDRASATSRIPADKRDHRLLALDIQGLRRTAAHHKRMTRPDDQEVHRSQHLTMQPNLDESFWNVWGGLGGYEGTVVSKVLTEEADLLAEVPEIERTGVGYRRAMALVKLCEDRRPTQASNPLVTVFVDGDGATAEAGVAVGQSVLDKVACTGSLEIIKTESGEPLAVGRRTRLISNKLRRFIMHRDGGCTGDGCTSRYRLEAHHIVPWSEGGSTDPDNLVTLCWFHHHIVVHGMGYQIDVSVGKGRVRFIGHDP